MADIENYVNTNLKKELGIIESSNRNNECPELTKFEKTIILKYTGNGYAITNETLRKSKGKNNTEFGKYLALSLNKLPNYEGLVYRQVSLTKYELSKYLKAFKSKNSISEYHFISSTKSRLTAMSFAGNVFFRIFSKTGKEIEGISMFGVHGKPNEKEILFLPNRKFSILDISKNGNNTVITMEEKI